MDIRLNMNLKKLIAARAKLQLILTLAMLPESTDYLMMHLGMFIKVALPIKMHMR